MFRVGQLVECIDARDNPRLVLGARYTVRQIEDGYFRAHGVPSCDNRSCDGLHLVETAHASDTPFYSDRFSPINERETSISFAHEILRKVTRKDKVRA